MAASGGKKAKFPRKLAILIVGGGGKIFDGHQSPAENNRENLG
jgi:hypothetical protein